MGNSSRHPAFLVAAVAATSAIAILILAIAALAPASSASSQPRAPDDVLEAMAADGAVSVSIALSSTADETRLAVIAALPPNVYVVGELETAPVLIVKVTTPEQLFLLQQIDGVVSATVPPLGAQFANASQPFTAELNAARPAVGVDQMHAMGKRGQGRVIAVLDSGIDGQHPDLVSSVTFERCQVPTSAQVCPNGSNEQTGPGSAIDDDGHGTEIAGIIASDGTIAPLGVAPDASLEVYKVGGASGLELADVLLALDYILANRGSVDVVNVSIASDALFAAADCGPSLWPDFYNVVTALRARGTLVVAPSGNQSQAGLSAFPACMHPVISVAATAFEGTLLPSSNIDSSTDVAAPGSQVVTTGRGGVTSLTTGTSFATPIVAACALLVQQDGAGSPAAIEARLESKPATNARGAYAVPSVACLPLCNGLAVTVNLANGEQPTPGPDVIMGTGLADEIASGMGDDTICALGGDDYIVAGLGNDVVAGGSGDDTIFGGPGADLINGQTGDDRINGGDGWDRLYGSWGHDTVNGGAGWDRIFGRVGRDILHGGGGNDYISGGIGIDTVSGGAGDDELVLGKGADIADGNEGDDILRGGGGWDLMQGGSGTDTCFGGSGIDTQTDCEATASVP